MLINGKDYPALERDAVEISMNDIISKIEDLLAWLLPQLRIFIYPFALITGLIIYMFQIVMVAVTEPFNFILYFDFYYNYFLGLLNIVLSQLVDVIYA